MSNATGLVAAAALVVGTSTGCDQATAPVLEYRIARPALDLGRAEWTALVVPQDTLSILNLGEQTLLVTPLAFEGEGSAVLTWDVADYANVLPGFSLSIPVRPVEDRSVWASGDYAVDLQVEVGAAWNDPSDFDVAPTWFEDELTVPVTFTLACDLDADGDDAAACGGEDCDDGGPEVDPGPRCDDPSTSGGT